MNMRGWKSSVLDCREVKALPLMTYPGLALTDFKIRDIVCCGENQATLIACLAARYPSAAAVTAMDLSVEAEAFGSQVRFTDTEIPTVIGAIVSDIASANALKVPVVGDKRTGECLQAAKLAARRVTDRPVFGGQIGHSHWPPG